MRRKTTLLTAFPLALIAALLLFSAAAAQTDPTSQPGMNMTAGTPQAQTSDALPTPTPDYGPMPMGSGASGMGMMNGMGAMGTMDGTMGSGQMTGTCPMMGGMDMTAMGAGMGSMTGMSGMTGMNGAGMTMQGGMAANPGMAGGSSFSLRAQDPWWLLGWALLGLAGLGLLAALIAGAVLLVRRRETSKPVQTI